MRWLLSVAFLVHVTSSAWADEPLQHTRDVIARHAEGARRVRTTEGVAAVVAGVALGVGGYFTAANAHESGGIADVSGLERCLGYSMLGLGAVLAIKGPLLLLTPSDQERMRDEVTDADDARYAQTEIATRAAADHRRRVMLRGIGGLLLGVGTVGTTIAVFKGDTLDRGTRNDLLGLGISTGVFGSGFVLASLIESRWETMQADLHTVPVTAGLVPVRGGAIAGLSGSF